MTQRLRDWSILSLIGFVALFFLLEINVWSPEMQNDRLVIVIALACLVASEIIWEKQSAALPLLLFFLYTAFMLLITLNGQSVVETIPYIRLLLPLSIPIAAYAVTPFEPTVQWGNLCIVLFLIFGGYGFYQFQFAQSPVNGPAIVMFWLGYLFFFTLVIRSQPYMQPRMSKSNSTARILRIVNSQNTSVGLSLSFSKRR